MSVIAYAQYSDGGSGSPLPEYAQYLNIGSSNPYIPPTMPPSGSIGTVTGGGGIGSYNPYPPEYAQYFGTESGNPYMPPSGGVGTVGGGRMAWTIQVTKNGSGSGMVISEQGNIDCGDICSVDMDDTSSVLLLAVPDTDSVFAGWSNDCSGKNPLCSFTVNTNKQVTALFNKSSTGENFFDNKDDEPAVVFQKEIKKIVVTNKKVWLGISPLGTGRSILQKLFNPNSLLGSRWKISTDAAGNQLAQGNLVGPGSLIRILVNVSTGNIYFQFNGNVTHYTASYFNQDGAQRTELVNAKGDIEQREQVFDADGGERQSALIAHGRTLFGIFSNEAVFMVDSGASPDASPASWARLAVPHSSDQGAGLIPVQKIIDMLSRQILSAMKHLFFSISYAAQKPLTAMRLAAQLSEYRKSEIAINTQISDLQNLFARIDFNDPYFNFDELQAIFDAYTLASARFTALGKQLGVMRAFVRPGDWLMNQDTVVSDLVAQGVGAEIAALIAQGAPPFDFFTLNNSGQKNVVLGGSCIAESDNEGNEAIRCSVRNVSAAQARVIMTRANEYLEATNEAHEFAGKIENALFFGGVTDSEPERHGF